MPQGPYFKCPSLSFILTIEKTSNMENGNVHPIIYPAFALDGCLYRHDICIELRAICQSYFIKSQFDNLKLPLKRGVFHLLER